MSEQVKQSAGFLQLNWRDLAYGLAVAVIGAALTAVYEALSAGGEIHWKNVGIVALTAGVSYLLKNLFTQQKTIVTGVSKDEVTVIKKSTGEEIKPK